jgi:hypothetical protein
MKVRAGVWRNNPSGSNYPPRYLPVAEQMHKRKETLYQHLPSLGYNAVCQAVVHYIAETDKVANIYRVFKFNGVFELLKEEGLTNI